MMDTLGESQDKALPAPRRYVWKTVALSAVLVFCGMFIGSGLTLIAIKRRADEFRARPELLSQRMVERMQSDLDLTQNQTDQIDKIFADARREAMEMRERNRAQAQAFFRDLQGKVSQVLTPSQQSEWEEWFRRARNRAMKGPHERPREENRGPGADRNDSERDGRFRYDGLTRPELDEPRLETPPAGDPPPPR